MAAQIDHDVVVIGSGPSGGTDRAAISMIPA